MSLRYEQYSSLLRTRKFLRDLMHGHVGRWTKKELRERAYSCLRHYPAMTEKGQPYWSRDTFTEDDERLYLKTNEE